MNITGMVDRNHRTLRSLAIRVLHTRHYGRHSWQHNQARVALVQAARCQDSSARLESGYPLHGNKLVINGEALTIGEIAASQKTTKEKKS